MNHPLILIGGIGNIFCGDDGFGVEVAQQLSRRRLPDGVRVVDFGIRGIDLLYALSDGYDAAILVDAVARGGPPGTLYMVEPEVEAATAELAAEPLIDMHTMDPEKVLRAARSLGGHIHRVLLVGCEPLSTGDQEMLPSGLSAPVAAAVGEAVEMIESLVDSLLCGSAAGPQRCGLKNDEVRIG